MKAHPTHLYMLLFNERKLDQLGMALEQTRARMEKEGELALWQYWDGMRLAALGRFDEAAAHAAALLGETKEALDRTIAVEKARQGGDWVGLAAHFEAAWRQQKTPGSLLSLCEAKINAGDPKFVVEHADELLKGVGTPEALRLVATAAARTSDWQACLRLLDEHVGLFTRAQLPADLRRLRVACEQNLGMLSDALRDAESLVSDESNLENLTLLFSLRVRAGRLPEAVTSAKSILNLPNAPAGTLIQIGWLMRLEDRELSQLALEKAVGRGIEDPQQVGMATMLAHELDRPKVLATLAPKMAKVAAQPNETVQALDFKATVEFLRSRAEKTQQMLRLFAAGGTPVHMVSELLQIPLAVWPTLALANRTHYAPGAVFFRHGGKPGDDVPQRQLDRIYVDVTAFIVAHEMEILPLIEKGVGALIIPPALRTSLVQQLDRLSRTPSADDAARAQVLSLLETKRIATWETTAPTEDSEWNEGLPTTWCAALEEAGRRDGLLVDYWPKLKDDGTAWIAPDEWQPRLTHAGALLAALEQLGLVTAEQSATAKERIAVVSTAAPHNVPKPQQTVLLTCGIAKLLAQAGLMHAVVDTFKVAMPADDAAALSQEEANYQDRAFVVGRIRAMMDHLATATVYQELVLKEPIKSLDSPNADAAPYCLAEILQAEPGANYWVWSDDRWLNGHQHVANLPVISTADVLVELRKRALIAEADYFAARHKMRVADFRYLPLAADELIYWLHQATTEVSGALVETAELVTLRQYWARALGERDTLQFPPVPPGAPNPQGETEFFSGGIRVLHDTFSQLFRELPDQETIVLARATWLLFWMWCPVDHLAPILGKKMDPEAFRRLQGSGEGLFFARMLDMKAFGKPESLVRYGEWLSHYLYDDPSRMADARRHVERTFEQTAAKVQKKTVEDAAHVAVLNRWYFNLPAWLRDEMKLSAKTRQRLRIRSRPIVNVGGQQFEADKFWHAAEDAFAGKPAGLVALETKEAFGLKIDKKGAHPVVVLDRKSTGEKWGFGDAAIALLDSQESRRVKLLQEHPEWFDGSRDVVRKEAKKIAAMHTMQERISALDRLRGKSVWMLYEILAEKCRENQGPKLVEMTVKDVDEYAAYLRCGDSSAESLDWEKSATALIDSVGLKQAFIRLAALPVRLPPTWLAAFDKLASAERDEFIQKFGGGLRSPLARAQLFRLRLRHASADTASVGETLVSDATLADTKALLQVVRWSWTQLGRQARAMSATMRLAIAWVHAGQLFEILRGVSDAPHMIDFFKKLDPHVHAEVLVRAAGEEDLAYPRHVSSTVLLVSAVGSAIVAEPKSGFIPSEGMRQKAELLSVLRADIVDLPKLEWLFDPTAFTNRLGSFLGEAREEQLKPFVSERVATFISSGELARQVEALVGAIEADPGHGNSWVMLGSVMRGRACPDPLKVRLGNVMRATKLEAMPAEEPFRCMTILALAAQAAELGGDELVSVWLSRIADLSRWLGSLPGTPEDAERRREMVIRCALTLARHGPVSDPVRCFCETILAAWRAWPDLGSALVGMLRLLIGLPHEQLASAWSLVLAVRQNATRQTGAMPAGHPVEIEPGEGYDE